MIATRMLSPELGSLPELAVEGLTDDDARALLASVLTVHVDEPVLDRLVSETHGNPLAVLEPASRPHGNGAGRRLRALELG